MPDDRINLIVLFGGQSAEHDVSRSTARHVLAAIDLTKYRVQAVGITRDGQWVRADDAIARAFTCYEGEPFVRVPKKRLPEVIAVSNSNYVEVGYTLGPNAGGATRLVTCFGVTDNLVKGGAGQAIQSMNLLLGLDERLTLEDAGPWP